MIVYPDENCSFCPVVPSLNVIHFMGMSGRHFCVGLEYISAGTDNNIDVLICLLPLESLQESLRLFQR